MSAKFGILKLVLILFIPAMASDGSYRADFSAYGCEVDGCGFESLPVCQSQLTEQKELFELATGLTAEVAVCEKRKRADRYYPVLEGRGVPERKMYAANAHSWRSLTYIHLLSQGIQRIVEGESGRTAGYFIDPVRFAPSGSLMLRVFFYLAGDPEVTRFSELAFDLADEECRAQKKYLEKKTYASALTPHASVFCVSESGSRGTTLLLVSQWPGKVSALALNKAGSFSGFSDCMSARAEVLRRFPETGIAVICKNEGSEFSAHVLMRESIH